MNALIYTAIFMYVLILSQKTMQLSIMNDSYVVSIYVLFVLTQWLNSDRNETAGFIIGLCAWGILLSVFENTHFKYNKDATLMENYNNHNLIASIPNGHSDIMMDRPLWIISLIGLSVINFNESLEFISFNINVNDELRNTIRYLYYTLLLSLICFTPMYAYFATSGEQENAAKGTSSDLDLNQIGIFSLMFILILQMFPLLLNSLVEKKSIPYSIITSAPSIFISQLILKNGFVQEFAMSGMSPTLKTLYFVNMMVYYVHIYSLVIIINR